MLAWREMLRFGLALLFVVGCLEPQLVVCGDGRACPIGTTCQLELETCVTDDQLTACTDIENGESCELEGNLGTCVEGACFEVRCGDRIVERGEVCDDGNFSSGDGCSADCRSAEQCGDGVFEPDLGEICEDGNSASGDGCNSVCEPETLQWRVRECGFPYTSSANQTAFDAKRGVLVVVDSFWLYEWNGSEWSCFPLDAPGTAVTHYSITLGYDSVREVIMSFEYNNVRSWNGSAWTVLTTDADFAPNVVTYDSQRDLFFGWSGFLSTSSRIWNPATLQWVEGSVLSAAYPTDVYSGVATYDPVRDEVVALFAGLSPSGPIDTWVWKHGPRTWTKHTQTWAPQQGVALAYHPTLGVVAFGGYNGSNSLSTLYSWNGTTWDVVATTTAPDIARRDAALAYDPSTSTLLSTGYNDVIRFANGAWTRWQPTGQLSGGIETDAIVSNPADRSLIAVNGSETWRFDGTAWSLLPAQMQPPRVITYRPDTQRVVGYAANRGLLELSGSDWVVVSEETWPNYVSSIAWDPTRGLVMFDNQGTWARTSTGWEQFVEDGPSDIGQLVYDYAADRLMLMGKDPFIDATHVYDVVGNEWRKLFSFSGSGDFEARTLPGRGTPLFVTPNAASAWEYIDGAWRLHQNGIPLGVYMEFAGVDWMTGEVLAKSRTTSIIVGIGYTSSLPRESCIDGEDLDTDGRSGCDDDDCWWRCEPACPPASSCFSD